MGRGQTRLGHIAILTGNSKLVLDTFGFPKTQAKNGRVQQIVPFDSSKATHMSYQLQQRRISMNLKLAEFPFGLPLINPSRQHPKRHMGTCPLRSLFAPTCCDLIDVPEGDAASLGAYLTQGTLRNGEVLLQVDRPRGSSPRVAIIWWFFW